MDKELTGKIALSKQGKKLGTINRVEGDNKSIILAKKQFAFVETVLGDSSLFVPLRTDSIIEIADSQVWFAITKKDFQLLVKKARSERKLKKAKLKSEMAQEGSLDKAIALDAGKTYRG